MTELTKTKVQAHVGHTIEFTADITVTCTTCDETVWSQAAVNEKLRVNEKARLARMKLEDPERYKEINRRKSEKHRARMKADPEKYKAYLEKARLQNKRSIEKRRASKVDE